MSDLTGYQDALEGAAFLRIENPGYLRISGGDRVDFLQRQTTNDVRLLDSTRTLTTVLTSSTARILDVLKLLGEGDHIDILTLSGRAESTASFLRSRIFFNDDVTLDDLSQDYVQIALEGPLAADILQSFDVNAPVFGEVSLGDLKGSSVTVIGQSSINRIGFSLLVTGIDSDSVVSALKNAGAIHVSEEIYDVLRIEAGIPGPNGELTDDFTPLEIGLQDLAISLTKGCYTGQEIIARQVNYDKITRKLVGLRLDAPVDAGAQVRADGKPAGRITSVASSPRFGEIALGILKRPFDQAGTQVMIGDIQAEVAELPFK